MNGAERRYGAEHPGGKVFRHVAPEHPVEEYEFGPDPYLGFSSSKDVYGDGSVVVVHAGGHTNGSVIVFVALPSGYRYAFVGDLTWQLDGIRRGAERPWLMQKLADVDPQQVREDLARMIALDGVLQIVPSHDLGSYEGIPLLEPRG